MFECEARKPNGVPMQPAPSPPGDFRIHIPAGKPCSVYHHGLPPVALGVESIEASLCESVFVCFSAAAFSFVCFRPILLYMTWLYPPCYIVARKANDVTYQQPSSSWPEAEVSEETRYKEAANDSTNSPICRFQRSSQILWNKTAQTKSDIQQQLELYSFHCSDNDYSEFLPFNLFLFCGAAEIRAKGVPCEICQSNRRAAPRFPKTKPRPSHGCFLLDQRLCAGRMLHRSPTPEENIWFGCRTMGQFKLQTLGL